MIKLLKIILTLTLPALLTLNFFTWQNSAIGTILVILYLVWLSYATGELFFKNANSQCLRCLLGSLITISYLAILGTIFFYVWQLGSPQLLMLTWGLPLFLAIKYFKYNQTNTKTGNNTKSNEPWPLQLSHYTLMALYVLVTIKTFILLSTLQTAAAIRSPWEILSSEFFITYAALCIILLIIYTQSNKFKPNSPAIYIILGSIHFFLTYSIALWIYQINFGFDPFIHQASEKLLSLTGTISPKPLLYIGHYTLVNWTTTMSNLNLILVDRLIVPLLTALLLPAVFFHSFTQGLVTKPRSALMSLIIFPILLVPFYFSVPQNLANLFLIITILLAAIYLHSKQVPLWLLWLLGAATLLIHPFSGIPLLIFLVIITLLRQTKISLTRQQKLISLIIVIVVGIALLPLALTVGGDINNTNIGLNDNQTSGQTITIAEWVPFYSIYHLVYLLEKNHTIILALLASGGLWLLWKRKQTVYLSATVLLFLILSIDVSLLELLKLPIIGYELPEFINRFWQISLLFISPLIFTAIINLVEKSLARPRSLFPVAAIFFLGLIATIGLYLSYPRVDGFTKSRAYATSVHDITAAQWIEQDARGSNYVVLSNQAVAAAALQEAGFKQYYSTDRGELFYYPIPTTSPLYEIYLDMVYKAPTKNRLQKAMEITGAETGYFVINDYWLDYEKIVEQANNEFGEYNVIGDNKLTIFKLQR